MQLPSPNPDESISARPEEPPIHPQCGESSDIVSEICSLIDVAPTLAQNDVVKHVISEFAERASARGFMHTEQRLTIALVSAFVVPALEENDNSIKAYARGLKQAFGLVDRIMAISIDPPTMERIEVASKEIAGKPPIVRMALRSCLDSLTPHLKNIDGWVGLLETSAKHAQSRKAIRAAMGDTQSWAYGPTLSSADARAAMVQYWLTYGRPPRANVAELITSRGFESTALGDSTRALYVRLVVQHQNDFEKTRVAGALRTILREEHERPKALRDLHDVLKVFTANTETLAEFMGHCRGVSRATSEVFLSNCGVLARAGYPPSLFTPNFVGFLTTERQHALRVHGIEAHVQQLAHGLAAFMDRIDPSKRSGWAREIVENLIGHHVSSAIRDPRHAEKLGLVLDGRNLPLEDRLSSMRDFRQAVVELTTQALIIKAVHTKERNVREIAETAIASGDVASADNPPFSILANATAHEVKVRFMSQIRHAFRRMNDGHYGFWSRKIPMSRSPITGECFYDNFVAAAGGQLQVIVSKHNNRFPGSGRIVSGLKLELIFASDPADADRGPLYRWEKDLLAALDPSSKDVSIPLRHPIDECEQTFFPSLRGMIAVTLPNIAAYAINREHMTYVEYNHHFDSSGVNLAYLVPTRVLWSFFKHHAVSYKPGDAFPKSFDDHDISDHPPTPANLRKRCHEMNTRVGLLNLGTGSNYFGGFCNGPDIGSAPYHTWEQTMKTWRDNFGHSHKYHIRTDDAQLKKLHDLHERAYAIFVAATGQLDLLKYAESIYAWGQNYEIPPAIEESWRQDDDADHGLGGGQWQQSVPFTLTDVKDEEYIEEGQSEFGGEGVPESDWKSRTTRMLEFSARLMAEHRQSKTSEELIPVLVITPTIFHARTPISPFIFDLATGIIWRRGQPPLFFDQKDGSVPKEIEDWWLEEVAPLAHSQQWVVPRLVPRQNYLDQLLALKAK